MFRALATIKPMKDASKDDELPFLELNDEIPAQWAIETDSSSLKELQSALPERSQDRSFLHRNTAPVSPPSALPQYALTTSSKVILSAGVVLIVLMTVFRVPPALVLLGIFSLLRVLFFPLAILGFVVWAWRYRR